jgi:hypothetical protein
MTPRRLTLLGILVFAGSAATAEAKVQAESRYTKTQTYHAALRYLRVDLEYEITERDADAAYLMFRYASPGRKASTSGAIQIVETRGAVRVYVQLPQMPEYHEQILKDGLMRKLLEEYGEPPPAGPPEKTPKDDEKKPPRKASGSSAT